MHTYQAANGLLRTLRVNNIIVPKPSVLANLRQRRVKPLAMGGTRALPVAVLITPEMVETERAWKMQELDFMGDNNFTGAEECYVNRPAPAPPVSLGSTPFSSIG